MGELNLLNSNGTILPLNCEKKWTDISNFQSYNIPILYLIGSTNGMSKDNKVILNYIYGEKSGTCTLKWQGASSIDLDKKNYTIVFDTAFEIVSGWGSQKKYCLKANTVDHSHARNLICAKLWGQIVKSRTTANNTLNALPNGGAVDGFPIIISLNGEFHGLYTLNIPKDGWLFGMSGTTNQQAILCADIDSNAVAFRGLANFESDFELEYSSNDESAWVLESINTLLGNVMNSDGTNITYGITPYLDLDSAVDYYIHTVLTAGYDGVRRNYILATHDGTKWLFSGYDMDLTFGSRASGKYFLDADVDPTFETMSTYSKLFELIWKYMRPQLRARYKVIREQIMNELKVMTEFYNFTAKIPRPLFYDDVKLWQTVPSSGANDIEQIINFYRLRVIEVDKWIESTTGEMSFPEQEDPNASTFTNKMPTSIDSDGSVFNSTGYQGGKRISSSGAIKDVSNGAVTGFISAKANDIIRFKDTGDGLMWNESGEDTSCNTIGYYNSSFAFLGVYTRQPAYYGVCTADNTKPTGTTANGGICSFTVPNNTNIAYFRMGVGTNHADGSDMANLIVTVNEEIS